LIGLDLSKNQLAGTFTNVLIIAERRYTSLPLAEQDPPLALAGSIPTEFGKLINMKILNLDSNQLAGTPRSLVLAGSVHESTTRFNNVLICAGRVDPHRVRQAHQHAAPLSQRQPTYGYGPVCSFYLVWYYESTTCFKTSSSALAGSIPTEFGKLINLKTLYLSFNKLTGTLRLLMLCGVVARVYHLQSTSCFTMNRRRWWWRWCKLVERQYDWCCK
jgi:Leucine-rich repeat (LRR) protein